MCSYTMRLYREMMMNEEQNVDDVHEGMNDYNSDHMEQGEPLCMNCEVCGSARYMRHGYVYMT